MKRIFLPFLVLVISFLAFKTFEKETPHVDYKLVEIPSPSLENAIIQPRTTYKIGINLPPSYKNSSDRYPVMYFLNGYTVYPGKYTNEKLIDSLMTNQIIKEMIVVELTGYNMF